MSGKLVMNFWLPMYESYGLTTHIKALAPRGLEQSELLSTLNARIDLPDLNWEMFTQYFSDVQNKGDLQGYKITGVELPQAIERNIAISGLGQSATDIWFDSPNTGIATIAWFVNGSLRISRLYEDLSTSRSITKLELGCVNSDIVQCCIVDGDIYGWWANIEIS